jgi:hypothetical protein
MAMLLLLAAVGTATVGGPPPEPTPPAHGEDQAVLTHAPLSARAFEHWRREAASRQRQPPLNPGPLDAAGAARYAERGYTTLRGLLPAPLVQAAAREVEEVWEHYHLPATFMGQAFLRDTSASGGRAAAPASGGLQPFDRLYNLEERSPALRRLLTFRPLGDAVARLMGAPAVRLYMSSYFRKAPGDSASQWHKDEDACPFQTRTPLDFATLVSRGDAGRRLATSELPVWSSQGLAG